MLANRREPQRGPLHAVWLALPMLGVSAAAAAQTELAPMLPDTEWIIGGAVAGDFLGDGPDDGKTADLRKAHIGGAVLWKREWAASLGAELSHGGMLGQASIAYLGWPVRLELGRFPEPFGLLQQEGSAAQRLMEYPAVVALAPGYGLGLAASVHDADRSFSIGVFAPVSAEDRVQRVRRREAAATARLTGLPFHGRRVTTHIGVALSIREPRDDAIQFRTIPETVLLPALTTDSAPLSAKHYAVGGLEFGVLAGPVLLQAESVAARFPANAGAHVFFRGSYVECGVALGALPRMYSAHRGAFGSVLPSHPLGFGGVGALEVAARYSVLDMTSNTLGDVVAAQEGPEFLDAYSGERSKVRAFGVNWYATDNVKLGFAQLIVENEMRSGVQKERVLQGRMQIQFALP